MKKFPFGPEWTCVVCWDNYPEDFEPEVCPKDGGHLHRIAYAMGQLPDDIATVLRMQREALIRMHGEE
jgi:hypothetical protein